MTRLDCVLGSSVCSGSFSGENFSSTYLHHRLSPTIENIRIETTFSKASGDCLLSLPRRVPHLLRRLEVALVPCWWSAAITCRGIQYSTSKGGIARSFNASSPPYYSSSGPLKLRVGRLNKTWIERRTCLTLSYPLRTALLTVLEFMWPTGSWNISDLKGAESVE